MIIPGFNAVLELGISRLTNVFSPSAGSGQANTGSGFGSGFLAGLSLGLVWSPCAGPILAAIAALAATGQVSFQVILVTLGICHRCWNSTLYLCLRRAAVYLRIT